MLKAALIVIIGFCILLFAPCTQLIAQPLIRVTGMVRDIGNHPLQQVTVSVLGQQESTLSAEDGSYTIYSKTTSFTLKFNLLGYQPVVLKINEKVAGRITRDVMLLVNI
ncbi:MAG: carboxypeptidase-like regulatory domain-containing protein, partial [Pedobacter sp.]|nr:carboxypeptidase-like regulatory domain-containing protein [Pedobacter sp.]